MRKADVVLCAVIPRRYCAVLLTAPTVFLLRLAAFLLLILTALLSGGRW